MPRDFYFCYSEQPELQEGPEYDAEDNRPIPVKGDTIAHKGRAWRVATVSLIRTTYPGRTAQPPMQVLVTLSAN